MELNTRQSAEIRDTDGTIFDPLIARGFIMIPLTPSARRNRSSHIWEHGFLAMETESHQLYWLCKICHRRGEHSPIIASSTRHSARHLRVHQMEFNLPNTHSAMSQNIPAMPSLRIPPSPFYFARCKARILEWAIKTNQTFHAATDSSHFDLLRALARPDIDISSLQVSRTTLRRWVRGLFRDTKRNIINYIAEAKSRISISFDRWTSSDGLPLIGVVAHFIDGRGRYQSPLLALRKVHGGYKGGAIASVSLEVLVEYDIEDKIAYFMLDHTSHNSSVIAQLAAELGLDDGLYNSSAVSQLAAVLGLDNKHTRLRCAGHTINLVTKPEEGQDHARLTRMALDLLACPAMSTECERAFFTPGRTIHEVRPQTSAATAEATECLRSWLTLGVVHSEDWMLHGEASAMVKDETDVDSDEED